jgi:flagellar biosynthesis/type III secretory pathway protein FliH
MTQAIENQISEHVGWETWTVPQAANDREDQNSNRDRIERAAVAAYQHASDSGKSHSASLRAADDAAREAAEAIEGFSY